VGDFGFAKIIDAPNSLVIENYRVGSPIFMPLETLERNLYSAKTDSFALGVLIYNLITREFPWSGSSNLSSLIKNYKTKSGNWTKI
jgi:serine/threonine protein kinase